MIIGVAGHIDHGKTTLIRTLTGDNTDRLKEEQERGISIELGFTYFDLPSGQRAGIIDVPGHERFIKNMLAGVAGMDLVILVVAATEGVMPQTKEHLDILNLLGIENGLIVITKTDMVEEEWIDLIEEEVRESVQDSFLAQAPILRASAKEKTGYDEIIKYLDDYSGKIEEKDYHELARLPVDRSFVISGFGTIVTGTLLSGKLQIDDEVEIYPGNIKTRIRTLQVHDEDTDTALAGQRVAINLAGVKQEDVDRGSVVAPIDSMKNTSLLDAKIELLGNIDKPIKNRTRVRIYIGSKEVLARIILLDRDELNPGDSGYCQLLLEEEIVAKMKDRFIIRFYSPMFTIGGGSVLDPNPERKKRFDQSVIEDLKIKEEGSSSEIIENIIYEAKDYFISIEEINKNISMLQENLQMELDELLADGKLIKIAFKNTAYFIHENRAAAIEKDILAALECYHSKYPLRRGMAKEEVRSSYLKAVNSRIGEVFLDKLGENGQLAQEKEYIFLKSHEISLTKEEEQLAEEIIRLVKSEGLTGKKLEDILEEVEASLEEERVRDLISYLIASKQLVRINSEILIEASKFKKIKTLIRDYFKENDSLEVGEFRDLLDSNRRTSIAILEYCDSINLTRRAGNERSLYKS